MKTFRSTVAVILSVLMLLSVCTVASISASAESTNTINEEVGQIIVTTTSNDTELATAKCDTNNVESITVTFKLQSEKMIMNCQGTVNYDSDALELVSYDMSNIPGAVYNTKLDNIVKFNGSNVQNLFDFTTAKDFCVVTFKAKADCNTTVSLDFEELNASIDPNNATTENELPLVSDGNVVGTFAVTSDVTVKEIVTPTEPTTPTQPATKAPSYKLQNSTINAGGKTKVTVYNANGNKVTYKSSKPTVAKIDSKGNITGLSKGTTKLTIKVGSKVFYKNLKVKTDPTVKDGKKTLKNKKTIVVKKGKTKKLTITGKASAIKNKVTVKSKKIAKITSKSTQTKVAFKAMKKGKTTLTIKINGVKTYKYTIRVK